MIKITITMDFESENSFYRSFLWDVCEKLICSVRCKSWRVEKVETA